jgi:riboflavin transporter FmnP
MGDEIKEKNSTNDKGLKKLKKGLLEEKEAKRSDFVFAIIANLIFLYIVNNLLSWNLSFITADFSQVLWILNISIGFTILGNIIFLLYSSPWFRHAVKTMMNILSFLVAYYLYTIFPFSFSQGVTFAVKFALIIVMVILVFSTAYEIFKLLIGIFKGSKK